MMYVENMSLTLVIKLQNFLICQYFELQKWFLPKKKNFNSDWLVQSSVTPGRQNVIYDSNFSGNFTFWLTVPPASLSAVSLTESEGTILKEGSNKQSYYFVQHPRQ